VWKIVLRRARSIQHHLNPFIGEQRNPQHEVENFFNSILVTRRLPQALVAARQIHLSIFPR
jgi:hypothetical protein